RVRGVRARSLAYGPRGMGDAKETTTMLPRYLIAGVLLLGVATAAGYFYGRQLSAPVTAEILAPAASPSPNVPITPPQSVAKDEGGRTAAQADDEHRRQARSTAPPANTFVKVREAHVGD